MKIMKMALLALAAIALAFGLAACQKGEGSAAAPAGDKIIAGFVYIGPVGDLGWTNAHDAGRKYVAEKYKDWLVTEYVESVAEAGPDVLRVIDRLVAEKKCSIIFTTSFGYMDPTVEAAAKYPQVTFMHCSGFKNAANLGTYYSELYQMYYLNGLMAGALTKSGKLGYVGAFPIPEVIRHIDAFALGVKAANPKATVSVRWINSWYDPAKAKEAAKALVAEGIDGLAFTEDSPSVIEVAQESTKAGKPVFAFSHYSPMLKFGPDAVVSGELVDWGIMYDKILSDFKAKTWSNADLWWKAGEGAAILGADLSTPINPAFEAALKAAKVKTADLGEISAYDLTMKRLEQMKAATFDPFTGPIKDQAGKVQIPEGKAGTKAELLSIMYFVDNVVGEIPASN